MAAIAARVYQPFDAKFAARNLDAARRAWAWTEKYPNVTFRNPPGVTTGEYGDANCGDERLWAAAELGRTTGEAAFNDFFLQNYAAVSAHSRLAPGRKLESAGAHGAVDLCALASKGR